MAPSVLFTVLLPVHRPPALLPFAIRSVLAQTLTDFELIVVCDGPPRETVQCALDFAARDARISVLDRPKGRGFGEAHRHEALAAARGEMVAQIGDDDLWMPHHLEEMRKLLAVVDFGNLSHVDVKDGTVRLRAVDLAAAWTRRRMLAQRWSMFGPTVTGYRLDAYRSLPEGWSPGPPELWNDLNMWRKFLRADGLRFGSRVAVTSLKFGAYPRAALSWDDRIAEIRAWAERIGDPLQCEAIAQEALLRLARLSARDQATAEDLKAAPPP